MNFFVIPHEIQEINKWVGGEGQNKLWGWGSAKNNKCPHPKFILNLRVDHLDFAWIVWYFY